jgi:hypothetical protein
MRTKRFLKVPVLLVGFFTLLIPASAQTTGRPSRITEQVDEKNLAELKGNTHPLARPEFDRGTAPADLPMNVVSRVLDA